MKINKLTQEQLDDVLSTTRGRKKKAKNKPYYDAAEALEVKQYFYVPRLIGVNIKMFCSKKYPKRKYRVIKYGKKNKIILVRVS